MRSPNDQANRLFRQVRDATEAERTKVREMIRKNAAGSRDERYLLDALGLLDEESEEEKNGSVEETGTDAKAAGTRKASADRGDAPTG